MHAYVDADPHIRIIPVSYTRVYGDPTSAAEDACREVL
jgi:hypothetical protein